MMNCNLLKLISGMYLWIFCGLFYSNLALSEPLDIISEKIAKKFSKVNHISLEEWQKISEEDRKNWLIFDVRGNEEYEKSHIAGAILISPETDITQFQDFIDKHYLASNSTPENILFYCSIGYRSSQFIDRLLLSDKLKNQFYLYNLWGGLFNWANNGKPVYRRDEDNKLILLESNNPSKVIHPYNWFWGRLLN